MEPGSQNLSTGGDEEGRGRRDDFIEVGGERAGIVQDLPRNSIGPNVGFGDLAMGETVGPVGPDERDGDHVELVGMALHVPEELRDLLLTVLAGGGPEHQQSRLSVLRARGEGNVLAGEQLREMECGRASAEELARRIVGAQLREGPGGSSPGDLPDELFRGELLLRSSAHDLLQTLDMGGYQVASSVEQGRLGETRQAELFEEGEAVVPEQRKIRGELQHAERLPLDLAALLRTRSHHREGVDLRRLLSEETGEAHEPLLRKPQA